MLQSVLSHLRTECIESMKQSALHREELLAERRSLVSQIVGERLNVFRPDAVRREFKGSRSCISHSRITNLLINFVCNLRPELSPRYLRAIVTSSNDALEKFIRQVRRTCVRNMPQPGHPIGLIVNLRDAAQMVQSSLKSRTTNMGRITVSGTSHDYGEEMESFARLLKEKRPELLCHTAMTDTKLAFVTHLVGDHEKTLASLGASVPIGAHLKSITPLKFVKNPLRVEMQTAIESLPYRPTASDLSMLGLCWDDSGSRYTLCDDVNRAHHLIFRPPGVALPTPLLMKRNVYSVVSRNTKKYILQNLINIITSGCEMQMHSTYPTARAGFNFTLNHMSTYNKERWQVGETPVYNETMSCRSRAETNNSFIALYQCQNAGSLPMNRSAKNDNCSPINRECFEASKSVQIEESVVSRIWPLCDFTSQLFYAKRIGLGTNYSTMFVLKHKGSSGPVTTLCKPHIRPRQKLRPGMLLMPILN
jgi:hypothetical protein